MTTPVSAPATVPTAIAAGDGTGHSWEATNGQTWETAVQEDAQGRIVVAAGETMAQAIRKRRKRMELNDYNQRHRRVVRDMIRYVYVLIDGSRWMRQKDPTIPPGTRLDVAVSMLQDFAQEYYDQNPLSHLGFILLKNGEAEVLTPLSSNAKVHKSALQSVTKMAAADGGPTGGGEFSLQNGLEVAGRSLGHQPRHGSREIVVLTAALSTCDPGFLLTETLPKLKQAQIRVSCFSLSAELHVCRKIAEETAGSMGVCLDKPHFRDWLLGQCTPPPSYGDANAEGPVCEMIPMGFPTRTLAEVAVTVHASREKTLLSRTAFTCPQCQAKNAELPSDCAVCGLKLVLAPHLARSFHHLFPVPPFSEAPLSTSKAVTVDSSSRLPPTSSSSSSLHGLQTLDSKLLVTSEDDDHCCYACLRPLGRTAAAQTSATEKDGPEEELLRFQCPDCKNYFCVDCDAFLHETLHSCPGCLTH